MTNQTSSLSGVISADLGNALAATFGSTISLTALQTALSATNALSVGTSDQMQAAAAVSATLAVINSQIAQKSTLVATPIEANADPGTISLALATAVSSAGSLAAAVNAGSYVGRIGTNLNGSGS